jgi:hypothetical protein
MVKALARAFRWRKLLEAGAYGSIEELAEAQKINPSYMSRILRLTLLAPDIVELVLDGIHEPKLILATLMQPFPGEVGSPAITLGTARTARVRARAAVPTTRPVVSRPAQGLCSSPP